MVNGGITDKLRGAFLSKKIRTLSELYKIAEFETEGESKYFISKHRVRSSLNRMKSHGEIKRVDDSTYKRVDDSTYKRVDDSTYKRVDDSTYKRV